MLTGFLIGTILRVRGLGGVLFDILTLIVLFIVAALGLVLIGAWWS